MKHPRIEELEREINSLSNVRKTDILPVKLRAELKGFTEGLAEGEKQLLTQTDYELKMKYQKGHRDGEIAQIDDEINFLKGLRNGRWRKDDAPSFRRFVLISGRITFLEQKKKELRNGN